MPNWFTEENLKPESIVVINKTESKWDIVDSPLTMTKCTVSCKIKNLGLMCILSRPTTILREQQALGALRQSFDMLIDTLKAYSRLHPVKRRMMQVWIGYLPSLLYDEIHGSTMDSGFAPLETCPSELDRKSVTDMAQLSSSSKAAAEKAEKEYRRKLIQSY